MGTCCNHEYFRSNVLVFGYALAPYYFHSTMRPIVAFLGWEFNKKCEWKPSRQRKFLGTLIDTKSMTFRPLPSKVKTISTLIEEFRMKSNQTLHNLQVIVGKLNSLLTPCPHLQLWLRRTYKFTSQKLEHRLPYTFKHPRFYFVCRYRRICLWLSLST